MPETQQPETQTAPETLAEALAALAGVDQEDAYKMCERYTAALQAGGFEDKNEEKDVVADLEGYGITPEMLMKAGTKATKPRAKAKAPAQAPATVSPPPPPTEPTGDDATPDEPKPTEPEAPLEDPDGQQALATGDPILLTNEVIAASPSRGEINIGAFPIPANEDHQPGDTMLVSAVVEIGPITVGGEVRKHSAKVVQSVMLDTGELTAAEFLAQDEGGG